MKALRATLDNLSPRGLQDALRARATARVQQDVLAAIDTSLVLVDQSLIDTVTGACQPLHEDGDHAQQLAVAAAALLRERTAGATILLLLPPADFVATHYDMAVSGEKLLRSALKLQTHNLIPAYEEPLLLALDGNSAAGVALWYPEQCAAALFEAFREQGLQLAALMPRILALPQLAPTQATVVLVDEDDSHLTQAEYQQGRLPALLSMHRNDLHDPAFTLQWQQACARLANAPRQQALALSFWAGLSQRIAPVATWCFIPAAAQRIGRDRIVGRQRNVAGIAVAAVLLLLCLPFVNNAVQVRRLEARIERLLEQSTAARQSQAVVYALEQQWGAIAEFPRQDVAQVLLTLNQLIDSSLSAFEIERGVVDISGFTPDPALLLEQLAEHEAFYNVGQSRSSSGNEAAGGTRFGIRFNVSDVDFAAYEQRHPFSTE